MEYQAKRKVVKAVKLCDAIYDVGGRQLANKGDWLVIEGTRQYYMTDKEFSEQFEAVAQLGGLKDLIDKYTPQKPYTPPNPWPLPYPQPQWPYGTRDSITVSTCEGHLDNQGHWVGMNSGTYVSKGVQ